MRKIISILLALCLTASLIAGMAVGTGAEETNERVLPRADVVPTLDGVRDDVYNKGFQQTLNFDTAGFKSADDEDPETGEPTPRFEPASAKISAVWYSALPDDAIITSFRHVKNDTQGGIYVFAEVKDTTRAWGVNNTSVYAHLYAPDPSSFEYANATPEFELSDSFWVFLDPLNYRASRQVGFSAFAFTSYAGLAAGNGNVALPVPSWREYFNWGIDGGISSESGAGGSLMNAIGVKVKSTVDYDFNENYPIPEKLPSNATAEEKRQYQEDFIKAYQEAGLKGYTLEMFIPWSATRMEIRDGDTFLSSFIIPKVGTKFGMGMMLIDRWFSYWDKNPIGTMPTYNDVQYYIYGNCTMIDFSNDGIEIMPDCAQPDFWPTYVLGDYGKAPVESICGDASGDGVVDISDAMLVLYHVANKALLAEEQLLRCDTNGDGEIDIIDAMRILYFVANKSSSVTSDPITKEEAADFVSRLNSEFKIANAKMPLYSHNNPGTAKFFPEKDINGKYTVPEYLYLYYVFREEASPSSFPHVNISDYPNSEGSGLLTEEEAAWLKENSDKTSFFAVKTSDLQAVSDLIYGKGSFAFGGDINSGYTKSGYYLLPGFPGFDAEPNFKKFEISSVNVNGDTAEVTVTETWHIPLWVDGEPIPQDDTTKTTVYTVEKNSNGELFLKKTDLR